MELTSVRQQYSLYCYATQQCSTATLSLYVLPHGWFFSELNQTRKLFSHILTSAFRTIVNQLIISWPQTLLSSSETERFGSVHISFLFKVTRWPDRHKMTISWASILTCICLRRRLFRVTLEISRTVISWRHSGNIDRYWYVRVTYAHVWARVAGWVGE
jgi:hypothetical protein